MSEDRAGVLTDEALGRSGLADMRPAYRELLVRLKRTSPRAFEEATRRYRDQVAPAIVDGSAEPIAAWVEYGTWLASRLSAGIALTIDPTGRARPFDASAGPAGDAVIVHVPEEDREPALLLATPESPSPPQKETVDLLVR